jgi:TolB-like protein
MLLEQPVRVRTREEIQQRLWASNTFVDFERGMNKVVHSLRETLGETARSPRFIETMSSGGYRFLPELIEIAAQTDYSHSRRAIERLAVLPIATGPQPDLIYLGGRIASCLIDKLASIPGIRVMAESTVKANKLDGLSPQQAARTLGVQAILCGELLQEGAGLQLRMELIDCADGSLLCGAHLARSSQSAAHFEEELAQEVLNRIRRRFNHWHPSRERAVA